MLPRTTKLLSIALLFMLFVGAPITIAHAWQGTDTPAPATPVPATPTADLIVETRAAPQPSQNFWERYGIMALIISAVVGSALTLLINSLFGPTLKHWGEQLRERTKGEDRRFLDRYIPALAEEHRYLKLVGISGKGWVTRPPLEEVYVSLHMGDVRTIDIEALSASLTVAQAMQGHDKLVILGEPGAGKSTLLDWLTLVACGEIHASDLRAMGKLLPIYLPLRACADDERPLHELMADKDALPVAAPAPRNFFGERLRKGGCLVLLDGLDEVVDEGARDDAADKINQLVRTYPDNRYVVTCRTAGWEEGLLTGDFTRLLIRDFSPADVQRFVTGWYRAVRTQEVQGQVGRSDEAREQALARARSHAADEANALIDALDANRSLADLARNPLILSLIALVHYRRLKLPEGRLKLYQECLDILLDVWDLEDKKLETSALSPKAKETVLRHIAYEFHTQGLTEADAATLKRMIEPLLPELECELDAAGVLRQIEERSGILAARKLDSYVFAHRTLQEYLTARVLADSPQDFGVLLEHLHLEPWREVTLLYAGMVKDATKIVKVILVEADKEGAGKEGANKEEKDGEQNMLLLAGQCLAEDVTVNPETRDAVLARLKTAFEAAEETLTFEQLGRTLAAIGGEDVASLFVRVLADGAIAQQMAAALALSNLGVSDQAVIDALKAAHTNGAEQVRATAFWALLELGQTDKYGMVPVAAGEFEMGSDDDDPDAADDEKPKHRLHLGDYYIGRHPVTNAEFARFVEATGYKVKYWSLSTGSEREQHPAIEITWDDAMAYAKWMGGHLPSEAQWEKAAGWDAEAGRARRWPWGDDFDRRHCNTNVDGKGPGATTAVGQYSPDGDSPYGCADMAGNVWEWCSTVYKPYPYQVDDRREELERDDWRVLRGGSWYQDNSGRVRCAYRGRNHRERRSGRLGFRIARGSLNAP